LSAWGVDYWFDKERLDAGQSISRRIEDAILARDIFIRVASGNVQQRPFWIDLETDTFRSLMADDENKGHQDKRRLITLMLDGGYIPRPFERAALLLDTTRMTQEQWLAELRRALGVAPQQGASMRSTASANEPPTRIVDALYRGDHVTITEAIEAANPGDRILVRPGLYREGLVIDKPLEIVGDGELGDVVVEASGADVILFSTTYGRVSKLTLRQKGDGEWSGVHITEGRLDLEYCDITSQSLSCIAIQDGADPRVRHNRIHDSKESGVYVYDNGAGVIEDNEIFANGNAGISVSDGGNPTVRRNTISRNGYEAIWILNNGGGTYEDNDLRENTRGAWDIDASSQGNVKRGRNQE
jgi:parallel beta-helix repeat protein